MLTAIGRRLTNGEIAAEFHVSVRTVESHVAALRRKLAASSRAELIEAAADLVTRGDMAGDDTSLIGRDDELDAISDRLGHGGLVTLVGPAGVGKSRLAREVARRTAGEFRFVDLAGVEPGGVTVAVADAVGIGAAEGADIVGGLRLALADRQLLVVIDNADLVTGALADLLVALSNRTGGLRILVTSRRRLGLAAESVYTVDPLALPVGGDVAAVAASPAARLLVDRARAVRPDFVIEDGNAAALAALCHRLDGLPLALELAAARLGSVGVAELELLLGDHMDLLHRPGADATSADRHSSLTAAVDWSWANLSDGDRLVLQAAACLPGPCSLPELRSVVESGLVEAGIPGTGAGPASGIDVARSVLDLVDQSMLEPRLRAGGTSSYRVLETIRAVAGRRTEPDRIARFRSAHARHHLAGVEAAVERSRSAVAWDYHDDRSRRTLLGALRWAAEHEPEVGAPLLSAIAKRYELAPTVAVLDELRRVVLDHAIPAGWPTEPLAWSAVALNYLDLAVMEDTAAVALERAADERELAVGRWATGFAASYLGREAEATSTLTAAEATFRDNGDGIMVGMCLMATGLGRGDPADAVAALESAMIAFLEAGSRWHAQSVRLMLARRAIEAELRLDEVPGWLGESASFAAGPDGLHHDRAHAQAAAAEWAAARGDGDASRALATEASESFRHLGDLRCLVRSLLLLARTEDDPDLGLAQARRAVGAAVLQADPRGQADAIDVVIALADAAGERSIGARARGAKAQLAGSARPTIEDLGGRQRTAWLEGLARGPASVALGHDVASGGAGDLPGAPGSLSAPDVRGG